MAMKLLLLCVLLYWRLYIDYWLPICWFGFFFLSFVLCSFWASKENRKYPCCIIGWMLVFDMMFFLREMFRGSPFAVVSEKLLWNPKSNTCTALYLWLMWGDAASYVMSVFLCIYIYKIIVQKVNLKLDHRFFWKFIATFFVYTTLYTFLIGMVERAQGYNYEFTIGTGCTPKSKWAPVLGMIQSSVIGFIQVVLLGLVVKYMIEVANSIPNVMYATRKKWYKILRFVLVVVCETVPRIYYNSCFLHFANHPQVGRVSVVQSLFVVVSIFYLLAGLVVFTNTFIWNWFITKCELIVIKTRCSQHSSLYNSTNFSSTTVPMENV